MYATEISSSHSNEPSSALDSDHVSIVAWNRQTATTLQGQLGYESNWRGSHPGQVIRPRAVERAYGRKGCRQRRPQRQRVFRQTYKVGLQPQPFLSIG